MSFLRTPGNSQVQTPQYTGVQMQASSSALPVPIVWGMTLVAPNIVWAGDFLASPQYSQSGGKGGVFGGGGGSGQPTGYEYFTALVFGLCEGPISAVRWGYDGQDTYSLYQLNCSVIKGTTPQTAWSYLSANHPKRALAYPGTALVVSPSFDLGSSSSVGTLSFEVVGTYSGTGATATDADPAQIVGDFLTNAQYGVGFPAASIDATTLYGGSGGASYQAYCAAIGIGLSPALTDQEAANSILARWLQLTNSTAVWSGGKLKIIPFGDAPTTGSGMTFVPATNAVYDLTDDDFIAGTDADPVIVTRSDPYATPNVVNLEVLSRAPTAASGQITTQPNYYAPTPVQARDQNAIETWGLRIGPTVTAHEICTVGIGQIAAQLILQRTLYIRNTYAFKLSWECCLLEPMDIVSLTDANLGLDRTPVRILEIAEDGGGLLSVTAEEYPGAIGSTPGYAVDASTNEGTVSRSVAPAPVNAPIIFEPPSELTGGVAQVRIAVSGGTAGVADPNWGGATIYASTDTITYQMIGAVSVPSRMGLLAAALGAPPAADTLRVSFAESGATIVASATPTLALVEAEIVGFTSAILTASNAYSLGGLSRRLYGQQGGAHAAGAPATILDASVFTYALPQNLVGTKLWFKLASLNVFGAMQQDLSTCTAYPYTPVGSGLFGPVSQAVAAGTSFDEGLASAAVSQADDDGLASDPYTRTLDMGLASEAAASLAVQLGGTGSTSAAGARSSLGAAASGANSDITSLTNLAGLGIGTAVDTTTNLFAMKSANALFDNAGAGVAITLNKASASGSAYHQFGTGYSARAQVGLLASERWRVAVSAAGLSFVQALDVDPATGHVGLAGYTADANNALGVLGTACLFAAATDSMRFTFSKIAAANDATLSFQTNFSARALIGTIGSDQFQLKVSPDGAAFYQVFVADPATGNTAFKALVGTASYAVAALPSGFNGALAFASNGRKMAEGAGAGTGVVVAYSNGQWRRLSDESVVNGLREAVGAAARPRLPAIVRVGVGRQRSAGRVAALVDRERAVEHGVAAGEVADRRRRRTTRRRAVVHLDAVVGRVDQKLALRADIGRQERRRFAAAPDLYGHGCCFLRDADTAITITAGTLVQAVDAPNVSATSYWLSWQGSATARVWQGAASGSLSAGLAAKVGGGTVNALLVTGLTLGTIANLEFGTGTLGLVQFEAALPNAGPTRFERRHGELALCQRYYALIGGVTNGDISLAGYAPSNGSLATTVCYPVSMRATPTALIVGAFSATSRITGVTMYPGNGSLGLQVNTSSAGQLQYNSTGPGSFIALNAEI